MNPLLLDESQTELRDLLRKALADLTPREAVQAAVDAPGVTFDADAWRVLVTEIGVTAMRLPEEAGGMGTGFREVAVVAEEVARALAPVPFLSSGVLVPALLGALDSAEAAELWGRTGEGRRVAVAVSEESRLTWQQDSFTTRATPTGEGWTVAGAKVHVLGAAEAETLLVVAAVDGDEVAVLAVDAADAAVEQAESLDLTRSWSRVTFSDSPARLLGRGDQVVAALRTAYLEFAAALAVEQAGICETVLADTVDYLTVRHQFAQPIGSFQALKHACADLAVQVDQVRTAADHAARSIGTPGAEEAVALANTICHPRAEQVVFDAMQLLGGIGFTWEHPMHLFVRRATANARMLGSRAEAREAFLVASGH